MAKTISFADFLRMRSGEREQDMAQLKARFLGGTLSEWAAFANLMVVVTVYGSDTQVIGGAAAWAAMHLDEWIQEREGHSTTDGIEEGDGDE